MPDRSTDLVLWLRLGVAGLFLLFAITCFATGHPAAGGCYLAVVGLSVFSFFLRRARIRRLERERPDA